MSFIRENLKSTYNSSLKGTDVACCDNIGIVESFVPIFCLFCWLFEAEKLTYGAKNRSWEGLIYCKDFAGNGSGMA